MTQSWQSERTELARELITALYQEGMFRTWRRDRPEGWELMSGAWSPFYITMREVPSRPALFQLVIRCAAALVRNAAPEANRLLGLALTGIPIAAGVAYTENMPMGFTRKMPGVRDLADLEREVLKYGSHALVEGEFAAGDRVALVDDVVTRFDSKEIAIRQLRMEMSKRGIEGVEVAAVLTLINRGRDTQQRAAAAGVRLESLVNLHGDGLQMLAGVASAKELAVLRDYLDDQEKYQDPQARAALLR